MLESFSGAEILTIAVIALVVFGPHRLPEIARTIGGYVRELRSAVTELRRGIEQEVGPIREPIKEIKQDLAKPVADVRQTLAQTAGAAKAAERDIKRSATEPSRSPSTPSGPSSPATATGGEAQPPPDRKAPTSQGVEGETPQARWIAPEPPTGVSPGDVWEGMGDPMPKWVHPPTAPSDPSRDLEKAGAESVPSGDDEQPDEEVADRDAQ